MATWSKVKRVTSSACRISMLRMSFEPMVLDVNVVCWVNVIDYLLRWHIPLVNNTFTCSHKRWSVRSMSCQEASNQWLTSAPSVFFRYFSPRKFKTEQQDSLHKLSSSSNSFTKANAVINQIKCLNAQPLQPTATVRSTTPGRLRSRRIGIYLNIILFIAPHPKQCWFHRFGYIWANIELLLIFNRRDERTTKTTPTIVCLRIITHWTRQTTAHSMLCL